MPKIKALVCCQVDECAMEQAYHLDMVRMWEGQPLCEGCYYEGNFVTQNEDDIIESDKRWEDLPRVQIEDLEA